MSSNWLDLSKNSNLYIQSYIGGFLDMSGGNIMLRNGNLMVNAGDTSLNGRLFMTNDMSMNSRVFVGGDTSLNGRIFIAGDISLGGRLFINANNFILATPITSDGSNNSRLGTNTLQNTTATNNTAFGNNAGTTNITGLNNTFLGATTNTTGTAFTQSTALGYGAQITGSNQIVVGTTTEKTIFSGDASLNGRLLIGGNTTLSGNIRTVGTLSVPSGKAFTISAGVTVNGISASGITTTTANMLSTNTATYGQTWAAVPGVSTSAAYTSVSLSSTGQYILACAKPGSVLVSNNYGVNFITNQTLPISSTSLANTFYTYGQTMTTAYIYTIVGSAAGTAGTTNNVSATSSLLNNPYVVTLDSAGNMYIAEYGGNRITFIPKNAGAYFGSSMTANFTYTIATMNNGARGLCVDTSGNVYITDTWAHQISFIPKNSGTYFGSSMTANIKYTIVGKSGGGSSTIAPEAAVTTGLFYPSAICVDPSGNLYIADGNNSRITLVSKTNQFLFGSTMNANWAYVIAGLWNNSYSAGADNILASSSAMFFCQGVNVDSSGNVYICDGGNNRARFLPKTSGFYFGSTMTENFIYTIATGLSIGSPNYSGGISVDSFGNVYISDTNNNAIKFIPRITGTYFGSTMTANLIYRIVGTGTGAVGTNGILASTSAINGVWSSTYLDSANNLYIADTNNNRIQFVPTTATIINSYNYSSVSISSTGQYQLACINGGSTYQSTDYGSTFTTRSIAGITSGAFGETSISSTGQYQIVATSPGSIYISNNYGTTFTQITTGASTTGVYTAISISSTGQYQLASANPGAIYISTNYGSTFTTIPALSTTAAYTSTSISSTGQYMIISINNGLTYLSSNYGTTFTANPVVATTAAYQSTSISSTGQYQIVTSNGSTGSVYLSTNYGQTFTANPTGTPSSVNYQSTAISSTGQYMIAAANPGALYLSSPPLVSTTTTNLTGLVTLTDLSMSGNLYTPTIVTSQISQPTITNTGGKFTNPTGLSTTGAYSAVSMTSSGQYQLACINGGSTYLSTNYGVSFSQNPTGLLTSAAYSAVSISSTSGQYMLACVNGGSVYLSSNAGTSFTANPTGLVTSAAYSAVSISSTGQYMMACINNGSTYLSTNYGVSFTANPTGLVTKGGYSSTAISSTGQYMLTCSSSGTTSGTITPTILSGNSPTTTTYGSYTVLKFTTGGATTLSFSTNVTFGYIVVGSGTYGGLIYGSNYSGGGGGGTSWGTVATGPTLTSGVTYTITVGGSSSSYTGNPSSIVGTGVNIIATGGSDTAGGASSGGTNNGTGGAGSTYGQGANGSAGTLVNIADIGITSTYYGGGGGSGYSGTYGPTAGGAGGGGAGAPTGQGNPPVSGTPNTGGGSGGQTGNGGNVVGTGGSGVVYIYFISQATVASAGYTYLSNNYGSSFSSAIQPSSSSTFTNVSVSSTGQYMMACANPGAVYVSNNYGSTFTTNPSGLPTLATYLSTSVSSTGQYMLTSMTGTVASVLTSTIQTGPINAITTLLSGTSLATTMELVFRGSRDGQTASAFHARCNGKAPLFFIFKADSGYIATAYVTVSFNSINAYVSATAGTCWLNNLQTNTGTISTSKSLNTAGPANTLYDGPSMGPTFGGGHDMYIPDNWTTTTVGYTNVSSYSGIGSGNTSLYFGTYNGWKITEMEVYTTTLNASNTLSNVISAGTIFPGTSSLSTVISNNGGVYLSTNYGSSFSNIAALSTGNYTSVAISSSGLYTTAALNPGSVYASLPTQPQVVNTYPFMNIDGYVGFTDASGSSTGADAKALVEINGVGNLTQSYSNASYSDNYSLYTSGSVLIGQNLNVASDRRIKTNIQDVVDVSALSVLRQLKPKQYTYIDTANRGTRPVWGYLAQDVKEILDYAVNTVTDYIPNIYYNITINGNILSLPNNKYMITNYDAEGNPLPEIEYTDPTIPTTDNFTPNQDPSVPLRIKLIDIPSKNIITTTIMGIQDEHTIIVADDLSQYTNLFLYGQQVTDFNVLDKNAVFTIASAALQEVDQELQTLKAVVDDLEAQVVALEGETQVSP